MSQDFRLVSSETVPLTKAVALQHRDMEPSPTERELEAERDELREWKAKAIERARDEVLAEQASVPLTRERLKEFAKDNPPPDSWFGEEQASEATMTDIYETITELDRLYNEVIQLRERDNRVLKDARRQLYDLGRDNQRLREALHRINAATNSELGMARLIAREALEGGDDE